MTQDSFPFNSTPEQLHLPQVFEVEDGINFLDGMVRFKNLKDCRVALRFYPFPAFDICRVLTEIANMSADSTERLLSMHDGFLPRELLESHFLLSCRNSTLTLCAQLPVSMTTRRRVYNFVMKVMQQDAPEIVGEILDRAENPFEILELDPEEEDPKSKFLN